MVELFLEIVTKKCYLVRMDETTTTLERREDRVRAVYEVFYKQNVSLDKAFEIAKVPGSTFYLLPEDERLVIADEVRADVETKRKANEEAQALARQEMLLDLRRDFTDAARDALTTLKDVMANAQSDFVREKAAVDILNFSRSRILCARRPRWIF